jgi:hypothetical protein
MGGGATGFNPDWMKKFVDVPKDNGEIERVRVDRWVEPHKTHKMKAFCRTCLKCFSIKEGWWAIKRHGDGAKHLETFKKSDSNQNEENGPRPQILKIPEALQHINIKKQFELTVEKQRQKAEVMLVAALANHGISERFHDCLNTLIPLMFNDSKVAKGWNMGRTKASTILTHGIDPYLREQVLDLMRRKHFSLNFDESTVNHDQLIALNVSVMSDEGRMIKVNIDMIEVTEGTSGEEIAEKVLRFLFANNIPTENIISDQTDGTGSMIGNIKVITRVCNLFLINFCFS